MNESKKLTLSKETLRCLDDDALTDVVGGGGGHKGGSLFCQSRAYACISNACQSVACVSNDCESFGCLEF